MKNKIIYLKDYKVPVYKVKKMDLEFDLYDDYTVVISEAYYYKNTDSKEDNNLELYWEELELLNIYLDWKELDNKEYIINKEWNLIIKNTPSNFTLKIITKIHPESNTSLMGLYVSKGIFCTQCESEGFRRITYYLDRPDVMTEFTTTIKADKSKYPILLSNWNKIKEWELENNRHFVLWHDPFYKPSYLFALVAWKLDFIKDYFITNSWRKIELKIFAEKHNINKCDFAMDSLKRAMKWDEEKFWLEYDLDLFMIVAVDDFNSWAMENKWLNIFNSKAILASKETTTDDEFIYVERVVAHEYFHNWTWDRVTCRDWFQLSLKEGLTVFRDSEFTADMHSRDVKRISDVRYLRTYQFREDSSPLAHPIRPSFFEEISNFYTVTVYEKWSEVVWMYKTILWEQGFRKWMDLYFKRHDWQAVTTEDFLNAMADANKVDLKQFETWYNQAGTPVVEIFDNYNEKEKKYTISFIQSCPKTPETENKKPFIIPIKLWLIKENWEEIKLDNDLIILTEFNQSFTFENIDTKVIPSLLRGFSAPVKIKYNYTHKDYVFLMKNDKDTFNKFEASQNYAKDTILNMYETGVKEIDKNYIDSLKIVINDDSLDNSFKAEVMNLPWETEIADIIWKDIKPYLIHEIREFFIEQIAINLKDELNSIYNKLNFATDYKFDSKENWNRKLKNICLRYLSYVSSWKIVFNQYMTSNNMTDKLVAFSILSNIESEYTNKIRDIFYNEWKNDNNVIDKWFSIQATSKLKNTLENIKKLSNHELFDITNPNKVRALFNSFANSNPAIFNTPEGYNFIASKVIEIDKLNPMIASRLAKSMVNWRNLENSLSQKLKEELIRISNIDNISKDLSEIINKALI